MQKNYLIHVFHIVSHVHVFIHVGVRNPAATMWNRVHGFTLMLFSAQHFWVQLLGKSVQCGAQRLKRFGDVSGWSSMVAQGSGR